MNKGIPVGEVLAAAGIPKDKILQYWSDQNTDVIWEHRRLLLRYRCQQSDTLKEYRRRLACLDYIIAQVEGAYGI